MEQPQESTGARAPIGAALRLEPMCDEDLAALARIYVECFPQRVARLFARAPHACAFYRDLLGWVRRANAATCTTARVDDRVVGGLWLALPGADMRGALLRDGFALRMAGRALGGRYGLSPRFAALLARRALGRPPAHEAALEAHPHVYVVMVEPGHSGRGIGARLLERAREACEGRFERIWLNVELDNEDARRFYEKLGWREVSTTSEERQLVWELGSGAVQ